MDKKSLLQLVEEKEGLTIEFKERFSSALARELVAFANTADGYVLLGVSDDGKLKGIEHVNKMLSQIQSLARECSPPIPIKTKALKIGNKEFIIIEVNRASDKPYSCGDGFFVRNGATSQKLKRDEVIDFLNKEGHVKFESLIEKRFDVRKHFDKEAYKNFLKMAGLSRQKIARDTLLQNLSLAQVNRGKLMMTKAGVLFFALEPESFIRHNIVTCVLYKGNEKVDILERKDFKFNLPESVEQTMLFLKKNLRNEYKIKELRRKEIWDVPLEALREAILNAVMHRDYAEEGASILVEIFDDRVSISNPGAWPSGFDRRDFGKLSVRRNPVMGDIFHRIGEVEQVGSGINRMKQLCKKNGNPSPKFEFSGHFFFAIFSKRSTSTPQVPDKHQTSTGQVPDKYRTSYESKEMLKVLVFCKVPRKVQAIMSHIKLKHRETFMNNYLHPMLEDKLLEMTHPDSPRSPKQSYITTPKGQRFLKK